MPKVKRLGALLFAVLHSRQRSPRRHSETRPARAISRSVRAARRTTTRTARRTNRAVRKGAERGRQPAPSLFQGDPDLR